MNRHIRATAMLISTATLFLLTAAPPMARGQDTVAKPTWEFKAVLFGNDDREGTKKLNELADDAWQYVGPLGNGLVAFRRQTGSVTRITFDGLDASKGAVSGDVLAKYLEKVGIQITETTPGTQLNVVHTRNLYEGKAGVPLSYPNLLAQQGSNKPISFTVALATPADSFGFTRVKLLAATASGVTHPLWKAEAFDAQGKKLDSASEALIRSFTDVPAATFTLKGPGITSIRFASDSQNFAAFSAVVLDDFVLTRTVAGKR